MLVNVKRVVQFDSVERQALATKVSAQYGSLAFMYAKAVFNKTRTLESISERMHQPIKDILAYVEENGYNLILE